MIPEMDNRLFEWGDYMRERRDFGLGYPRRSIIHKAMHEGPGASQTKAPQIEPMPSQIAEIEESLTGVSESLRKAIELRYICQDIDKVAAQKLRVSVAHYRHRINHVHYYIAGVLGVPAN